MDDNTAVALAFMALLDSVCDGAALEISREDLIPYMPDNVLINVQEDIAGNYYRFELVQEDEPEDEEITRYKLKAGFYPPEPPVEVQEDHEEPASPMPGKRWRFGKKTGEGS